jgi:hypothetical protein
MSVIGISGYHCKLPHIVTSPPPSHKFLIGAYKLTVAIYFPNPSIIYLHRVAFIATDIFKELWNWG